MKKNEVVILVQCVISCVWVADAGEEHAMLVGNILVDVVRTGQCTIQLSHSRHSSQYDADQTAVLENIPQDPTIHAS